MNTSALFPVFRGHRARCTTTAPDVAARLGRSELQAGSPATPGPLRHAAELADTVASDSRSGLRAKIWQRHDNRAYAVIIDRALPHDARVRDADADKNVSDRCFEVMEAVENDL